MLQSIYGFVQNNRGAQDMSLRHDLMQILGKTPTMHGCFMQSDKYDGKNCAQLFSNNWVSSEGT